MNTILSTFSKEAPETFLKFSNQTSKFPVDIAEVCYKSNIRLMPFDFNMISKNVSLQCDPDTIRGAIVVNDNQVAFLYRKDDTTHTRRFTIAHLLGHLCLHAEESCGNNALWIYLDFQPNAQEREKKELEADKFARNILIPTTTLVMHSLMLDRRNQFTANTIYNLSIAFMVSEETMRDKLTELGYQISK